MGTGRRSIIHITFFLAGVLVFLQDNSAQTVRVGLFDDEHVTTCVFHCTGGSYRVFGDSIFSREIKPGELVYISMMSDKLVLMDGDMNYSTFTSINFRNTDPTSSYRLKLVDPVKEARNYTGLLEVNLFHGYIQLIDVLTLDDYIAGVVEAEGGPAAPDEYYKAQAILCRSFAIKNWEKHPGQNFNLCDNTHCQSFQGISDENPHITEAVLGTHGLVLVDQNYFIVSSIFHSNSGGETQRASDVWNSSDDYLQAVLDPFSEGLRNSRWDKIISRDEWKQYLSQHMKTDISKLSNDQLLVKQDHRKKYFIAGKDTLRLADIRTDLGLKSSFFTMEAQNDSILIHGKGYGHGVGMSQEGAMEMARQGYSYSDILRFYFYNVQVMELSDVPASGLPEGFR